MALLKSRNWNEPSLALKNQFKDICNHNLVYDYHAIDKKEHKIKLIFQSYLSHR